MICKNVTELEQRISELRSQLQEESDPLSSAELESKISTTRVELETAKAKCETAEQQLRIAMSKMHAVEGQVGSLKKLKKGIIIAFVLIGATVVIGGIRHLNARKKRP